MDDTMQSTSLFGIEYDSDDSFNLLYSSLDMAKLNKLDAVSKVNFLLGKLCDIRNKYETIGRTMAIEMDTMVNNHTGEMTAQRDECKETVLQLNNEILAKKNDYEAKCNELQNSMNFNTMLKTVITSLRDKLNESIVSMNDLENQANFDVVSIGSSDGAVEFNNNIIPVQGESNVEMANNTDQSAIGKNESTAAINDQLSNDADNADNADDAYDTNQMELVHGKENVRPQSTPISMKSEIANNDKPTSASVITNQNAGTSYEMPLQSRKIYYCPSCNENFIKKSLLNSHLKVEHRLKMIKKSNPGKFVKLLKKRKRDDEDEDHQQFVLMPVKRQNKKL